MEQTIKTDVVIIGAGPTGLSLATQLIRYGIDFVVVEKNEGVTPFSKAIGVQARTLEIYEQLGLTQKAVEQGAIAGKRAGLSAVRYAPKLICQTWDRVGPITILDMPRPKFH